MSDKFHEWSLNMEENNQAILKETGSTLTSHFFMSQGTERAIDHIINPCHSFPRLMSTTA